MSKINELIPGLAGYPRVALGHVPTPIDAAPVLGELLGIELLVKRDDCTGLAFGGNKVRQLEYYLGEADVLDADVVLITGAVQSNFVRTTAAGARRMGMDVHIQLEERVANVDEFYRASGNVFLDRLLGAHLHTFPAGDDESAADRNLERIADELRAKGQHPYVIHLGVDHPPIGAFGYVRAAAEIAAQLSATNLEPDAVVVASGSGLTHAGLLVGLRAADIGVPVHGICVRRDAGLQLPRVEKRTQEVASLLGAPDLIRDGDVRVTDVVLAPGYGALNPQTVRAIIDSARMEALILDPVYTGKTMAGLIALVESGEIARGAKVLFIHTGGQPAIFGYQRILDELLIEEGLKPLGQL